MPCLAYPRLQRRKCRGGTCGLLQTYADVHANGHAGFVAIVKGEAGVGKTRLAEEFLAHVQREGATVLAADCYEGETNLAYGPIIAGLRSALAQQEDTQWLAAQPSHILSETARLLPELLSLRPDIPVALPLESLGACHSLPAGVSDLLRSRLLPVSELSRQLLHTASIIGRSFDFDTLCEALS